MKHLTRLLLFWGAVGLLGAVAPAHAQQLTLADFDVPAGKETLILALLTTTSPTELCTVNNCTASIIDGSLDVSDTLTINRDITLQAFANGGYGFVRFRRSGTGSFNIYFQTLSGSPVALYPEAELYIQTAADTVYDCNGEIYNAGGGFAQWRGCDPIPGLTTGQRVIVAIVIDEQTPSTDNCDMYLGGTNLTAPGDLKLGASDSARLYLGSTLVCGDAP